MNPLKKIRLKLDMTQQALADGIGCTQGNIGHYERGQTIPPDRAIQIIKFAKKHGVKVSMDEIYGLNDQSATKREAA